MSFLSNLPNRGFFSSEKKENVPKPKSLNEKQYIPYNDTDPPPNQNIKNDTSNVLVRLLSKSKKVTIEPRNALKFEMPKMKPTESSSNEGSQEDEDVANEKSISTGHRENLPDSIKFNNNLTSTTTRTNKTTNTPQSSKSETINISDDEENLKESKEEVDANIIHKGVDNNTNFPGLMSDDKDNEVDLFTEDLINATVAEESKKQKKKSKRSFEDSKKSTENKQPKKKVKGEVTSTTSTASSSKKTKSTSSSLLAERLKKASNYK